MANTAAFAVQKLSTPPAAETCGAGHAYSVCRGLRHLAKFHGKPCCEDWQQSPEANPVEHPQKVYFMGCGETGPIKIGIAADPEYRRAGLQTAHHEKLTILCTTSGGKPVEREYHQRFAAHRLEGEWFARHPDILAEIEGLSA